MPHRLLRRAADWYVQPPTRAYTPAWFAWWAICFLVAAVIFTAQAAARPFRREEQRRATIQS